MSKPYPTQDRLKDVLHYAPETGLFTWRMTRGNKAAGSVAGHAREDGYVEIGFDGGLFKAHRLAWLYVYGTLPDEVDHRSGNKHENRIENLRPATRSENRYNIDAYRSNKSGHRGVSWDKKTAKWRGQVSASGDKFTRFFAELKDAVAWVDATRREFHGNFYRQSA